MKIFFQTKFSAASFALLLIVAFAPVQTLRAHDDTKTLDARNKVSVPLPFEPSEQLTYEGEFSKFLLRGIKIAEFTFTASRASETDSNVAKRSAESRTDATPDRILFKGDVTSAGWFHKLFGIDFRFRVESLVEREGFAVLRTKMIDEQGKRVRESETLYDRTDRKLSWTETDPNNPKREPRVVQTEFQGSVYDILSAIYFLRTKPLAHGQSFDLALSDSGRVYVVPAKVYAEDKPHKTALGKVRVLRLEIELFGNDRPVEGDGKMLLWITNDARRIPVRARMSSDIGQLDIKLKKFSNNSVSESKRKK